MGIRVMLQDVRLAGVRAWEAKEYRGAGVEKGNGKPKYNAGFYIVPNSENDKRLRAAIKAQAAEVFKDKADKIIAAIMGDTRKLCYLTKTRLNKDGDPAQGAEGMYYLTSARHEKKGPPAVIGQRKDPKTGKFPVLSQKEAIAAKLNPYAGCYVNAAVEIWAYDGDNRGIFATTETLQFLRDGDAFGFDSTPSDDGFEEIDAGSDADDML